MNNLQKYSITSSAVKTYLDIILNNWTKLQTQTNSGLYVTYTTNFNSTYGSRVDVYDNALLANCLIMINKTNLPDPKVIYILDFLYGAIEWLKGPSNTYKDTVKLIVAAYGYSDPYDPNMIADSTQDVGNNSIVAIAFAKFCLSYPNHEKTPLYHECVKYLISTFVNNMSCDGKGIVGHYPLVSGQNYVSTEHMIDCYALAVLGEKLKISIASILKDWTQTFVKNAYDEQNFRYYIGSNTNACDSLNRGEYPVDVNTWNMLSGVDDDKKRKFDSLKWVFDNAIVSNDSNPGIEFSASKFYGYTGSKCSQYENTGSFLCSLSQYNYKFNDDIYSKLNPDNKMFDMMYAFLYNKIKSNLPIQSAYSVNDKYKGGCDGKGCCSFIGGNPWQYYLVNHLGSTVYCSLALLFLNNNNANIYQFNNNNTPEPITPEPITPEPGTPEPITPITPTPGTPNTPEPGTPEPITPITPTPGTPNTPEPGTPEPGTPNTFDNHSFFYIKNKTVFIIILILIGCIGLILLYFLLKFLLFLYSEKKSD
jgi:hypothetical protein